MKSFMKKTVATMLVMALCLTGVSYQKQTAKAADLDITYFINQQYESGVAANTEKTLQFTIPTSPAPNVWAIGVYTYAKTEFSYAVLGSDGSPVFGPKTVAATETAWGIADNGLAYYSVADSDMATNMKAGTPYTLSLTFAADQTWVGILGMLVPATPAPTQTPTPTVTPSLDSKSITVTKGFKEKISVVNAGGAKLTFTSNNTKVATVDGNGTVTGKKKGNAVITVKTSTGFTMTCNVAVKDNVFSIKQLSGSDVSPGKFVVDVYKISYDKKGNLILKTKMINKRGYKAKYLKNFKITIKNDQGKKIGVYSAKKMTVNLKNGKTKTYTFKIKKSKVKANQDLRNIDVYDGIKISGKYFYYL